MLLFDSDLFAMRLEFPEVSTYLSTQHQSDCSTDSTFLKKQQDVEAVQPSSQLSTMYEFLSGFLRS